MKTVRVNLGNNSYTIQIGAGLLAGVADQLKGMGFKRKAVVVTNLDIKRLYGDTLAANLEAAGFSTALLEVPEGEEYKNFAEAGRLYEQLSAFQAERLTPVQKLTRVPNLAPVESPKLVESLKLVQSRMLQSRMLP